MRLHINTCTLLAFLLPTLTQSMTIPCNHTTHLATRQEHHSATLHDYPSMSDPKYANNPPFCSVYWNSLDLSRVVAYNSPSAGIYRCGDCVHLCGPKGCADLLVIDRCTLRPGHFDISTGAGIKLSGSQTGNWEVSAMHVDASNCKGIWDGRMWPHSGILRNARELAPAV